MKRRRMVLFSSIFMMVVFSFLVLQGCERDVKPKFDTEYQAVLLTNGQVFYGKSKFEGTDYLLLKNVFYVRRQVNPETKQVSNTVLKKGAEWHGAEQMHINTRHIIAIEPVAPESQLARVIKEANAQTQKPAEQKQ